MMRPDGFSSMGVMNTALPMSANQETKKVRWTARFGSQAANRLKILQLWRL